MLSTFINFAKGALNFVFGTAKGIWNFTTNTFNSVLNLVIEKAKGLFNFLEPIAIETLKFGATMLVNLVFNKLTTSINAI
ncbi:MAG: hypothetical protein ACM3O3_07375 [Syntrophothermus sp.]